MLCFTVLGEPVTKGSVTAFVPKHKDGSYVKRWDGSPMVVKHDDTGARGKSSAADIARLAMEARTEADLDLWRGQSLQATLYFYIQRPKAHFGTGKNAGLLKDTAPARPAKRPDVDKYCRHIFDAIKGILYADDGQVARVLVVKEYGDPARTEVEIGPMPEQTVRDVLHPELALAA